MDNKFYLINYISNWPRLLLKIKYVLTSLFMLTFQCFQYNKLYMYCYMKCTWHVNGQINVKEKKILEIQEGCCGLRFKRLKFIPFFRQSNIMSHTKLLHFQIKVPNVMLTGDFTFSRPCYQLWLVALGAQIKSLLQQGCILTGSPS